MGISVIIPLYNKARYVRRAIESVLRQDVETEIVVVDDGSTDGSGEIVESYGSQVNIVRQENAGPAAARNRGAAMSRFPFLTFLDADDEFLPSCLAAHLACRRALPGVKVTLSPPERLQEEMKRCPTDFAKREGFYYTDRFLHSVVTGMPSDAMCVDRDVFEALGGFDVELRCWEITDLLYRLMLASPVVGLLDKNYVVVHTNPANSQFARTKRDILYRKLLEMKRLRIADQLTTDQKKLVLRDVARTVRGFLSAGALADAKELLRRARPNWSTYPALGALRVLSDLPDPLIRAIVGVKRTIRSISASRKPRRSSRAG